MRVNVDISAIDGLVGKLQSFEPGNENHDGLLRTVATTIMPVMQVRIHEEGKAADDSDIGTYSTKPIYVSVLDTPGTKLQPVGKTGNSEFKTGEKAGQAHMSRYFPGGYNEFKSAIGRNTLNGKVNLSLSDQLNKQLSVQATDQGYGLGWPNAEMFARAGHLERKYGKKIWALTAEEGNIVSETAENYMIRALSE